MLGLAAGLVDPHIATPTTAGCTQTGGHGGGQQHMAEQHARMQTQMQTHIQGNHGGRGMRGEGTPGNHGNGNENCPMQHQPKAC